VKRARTSRWRRATQLAVVALYLAIPAANAASFRSVAGSLASTRLGPLDLVEPSAAASALLAGGAAAPVRAILLGAAPPALLALVLGGVFCSWLCPFGLLSETLDWLVRRGRPRLPAAGAHERVRVPRAMTLAVILAASALAAMPIAALVQGPRAVTVAALEAVYLGTVSPFAGAVLGTLLVLDLVLPRRLFCRALCPAGALANYLRTPRTLRVAFDPARCGRCAGAVPCRASCPWAVDPRTARRFDGCTSCLDCIESCPHGALRATFASPQHLTQERKET
jgi:ferredoxin-type protein NapH